MVGGVAGGVERKERLTWRSGNGCRIVSRVKAWKGVKKHLRYTSSIVGHDTLNRTGLTVTSLFIYEH